MANLPRAAMGGPHLQPRDAGRSPPPPRRPISSATKGARSLLLQPRDAVLRHKHGLHRHVLLQDNDDLAAMPLQRVGAGAASPPAKLHREGSRAAIPTAGAANPHCPSCKPPLLKLPAAKAAKGVSQSFNTLLAVLQMPAARAAIYRRPSCNLPPPELQSITASAAIAFRRSCHWRAPELQSNTAGAAVNGDVYMDMRHENSMILGHRRSSKGVDYLVSAFAAEAEAISAT